MCIAQLTIVPASSSRKARADVDDAARWYLGLLYKHGQMYGEPLLGWVRNRLQITLELAGPDAHLKRSHSKWGLEELAKLRAVCKTAPRWKRIACTAVRRRPVLDWRKETALYLLTGCIEDASPVRAGSTGRHIPPYLLPLSDRELECLCGWASYYRAHDDIWIGSADLEIPAYKQLADPHSELSKDGRTVRQSIERATGLPTYYYLNRYFGRQDKRREDNRRCPGCGRRWRRKRKAAEFHGLGGFDFRCDHCRLISDAASDVSDERHAPIGECRPRSRRKATSTAS